MSSILANDVRAQYDKSFSTIRDIVEIFPKNKWLEPHGDEYYIPCRIAYHLAIFIDRMVANGFQDPDFTSKLPYGSWTEATANDLPDKTTFLSYYDEVIGRAQEVLAFLDDDILSVALEPERAWMGTSQIGAHLYSMRELSAHTGELNKMLIENGVHDVWNAR